MNLVFAYFDPSAGSLLLQALVGGFGGIVVLGRYVWLQVFGDKSARTDPSQTQKYRISPSATSN